MPLASGSYVTEALPMGSSEEQNKFSVSEWGVRLFGMLLKSGVRDIRRAVAN